MIWYLWENDCKFQSSELNKSAFDGEKMIQKVNLKENVNEIENLFCYKRVGTLNNHMLNVLQAENRTLDFHLHENSDEMLID